MYFLEREEPYIKSVEAAGLVIALVKCHFTQQGGNKLPFVNNASLLLSTQRELREKQEL